jgi:hypothetical protein
MRLVALGEGPDIPVDRAMIVVGRHPTCDTRLESLRVSRRHCCLAPVRGEMVVRDLGSTNGIRINGHRVETGRLRPGDELSIAHIRYKLDGGRGPEMPPADRVGLGHSEGDGHPSLSAAVRDLLLLVDNCLIQVIVQMKPEAAGAQEETRPQGHASCHPALSP